LSNFNLNLNVCLSGFYEDIISFHAMGSCGDWLAVEDEAERAQASKKFMQQPLPRYQLIRQPAIGCPIVYFVWDCLLVLIVYARH
jgi:hypothetical protein